MDDLHISPRPTSSAIAELVLVQGQPRNPVAQDQILLAARCYGLSVRTVCNTGQSAISKAMHLFGRQDTVAAIIDANALPTFNRDEVLGALRRPLSRSVPLLITGITPETASRDIVLWSNGMMNGCYPATSFSANYLVGQRDEITRQLAGQEIDSNSVPAGMFDVDRCASLVPLLSFSENDRKHSVFVRYHPKSEDDIFFLADMTCADPPDSLSRMRVARVFSPAVSIMMFVRHAAGDRGWHAVGSFANLTIDDPWLTEPFGGLNYKAILAEMNQHEFHTTIAFIPWNFDRSKPEVVELFRSHPNRFSVCFHGNNHKSQEFAEYRKVPLAKQSANIKQAIVRMRKLNELTRLDYDRVMVFPHRIAPERTLAVLKQYAFLATANSNNVPLDATAPEDPLFYLRPATLEFANFPSLIRYSAEVPMPRLELAVNAFLGNPLLFYGHECMFASGVDAFNPIASAVNTIEPQTRWTTLGTIAQHLYFIRKGRYANYDVDLLSRSASLSNPSSDTALFRVSKREDSTPPIRLLTVNGRQWDFHLEDGILAFEVSLAAGESAQVEIAYEGDVSLHDYDYSKNDVSVALVRWISDLRDITFSKSRFLRLIRRVPGGRVHQPGSNPSPDL
jgi:hypothetical protein